MTRPNHFKRFIVLGAWLAVLPALAQETNHDFSIQGSLTPLKIGSRLDDNVFRSTMATDLELDEITSVEFGGKVEAGWRDWKGELRYEGIGDAYLTYDILDNLRNDCVASLNLTLGNTAIYLEKELFLRNSHYDDFDYTEDGLLAGIQWNPTNPLNLEMKYKNLSREYGSQDPTVRTQNFVDNSGALSASAEINERVTVSLEGDYTNREFNRNAILQVPGVPGEYQDAGFLQTDQSYGFLVSAQLYIQSILQNFSIQHQRTDSNSYGFSNSVDSLSWAAVIRPSKNFYLQLFARLYEKVYDQTPIPNPDLRVGFTDEDSQDLISAKSTWEFEPLWSAGFSFSRMKTESNQPGEYYIKNVEALQIERKF
jgi:hypothetical protein